MSLPEQARAWNRSERNLPLLLCLDFALFAALLIAYLVARSKVADWPRPFHFPSGLMTVSMIMFAGAAGFVLEMARKSGERQEHANVQRMLALAIVGWATFLFLLGLEWARLWFFEQVTPFSNPWNVAALGTAYYGFTTFHALHVAGGLAWLLPASLHPERASIPRLALYVHFANAMFLIIAFFVILSSTNLAGF